MINKWVYAYDVLEGGGKCGYCLSEMIVVQLVYQQLLLWIVVADFRYLENVEK